MASFGKSIDILRITWHFIGTLGLGSYISDHNRVSVQNFFHSTIIAFMSLECQNKFTKMQFICFVLSFIIKNVV